VFFILKLVLSSWFVVVFVIFITKLGERGMGTFWASLQLLKLFQNEMVTDGGFGVKLP
jgi:hypothetical protein